MEDLLEISHIINEALLRDIISCNDFGTRIQLLLYVRLDIALNIINESDSLNPVILKYADEIISVVYKYSRRVATHNFFGICIQRILDMSDVNINKLIADISVDTLNIIFSSGNSCETQKYIETKSDKKIIEMKCLVCENALGEIIKTYQGKYIQCTNCYCPVAV